MSDTPKTQSKLPKRSRRSPGDRQPACSTTLSAAAAAYAYVRASGSPSVNRGHAAAGEPLLKQAAGTIARSAPLAIEELTAAYRLASRDFAEDADVAEEMTLDICERLRGQGAAADVVRRFARAALAPDGVGLPGQMRALASLELALRPPERPARRLEQAFLQAST